jgi:hypothetical protein
MTTKLLVALQNSLLTVESSNNNGWKKRHESLKGLSPQSKVIFNMELSSKTLDFSCVLD